MDNTTYYQRNREKILNKAKDYYKNNNERLREHARNKYRNLSEEDKIKKREYGRNRYHNISEEDKIRQEINIKTYLQRIKIKKENMEKIVIIICLKKKSKN